MDTALSNSIIDVVKDFENGMIEIKEMQDNINGLITDDRLERLTSRLSDILRDEF